MPQEKGTCPRCGRQRLRKYMERLQPGIDAFRCGARESCKQASRRAARVALAAPSPQAEPVAAMMSGDELRAAEADAMLEPPPSAMLAGVHITRPVRQDCACRGKHQHRYGYTQDCTVRDCTCDGSASPQAEPPTFDQLLRDPATGEWLRQHGSPEVRVDLDAVARARTWLNPDGTTSRYESATAEAPQAEPATCPHGETEAHDTFTVHMWPPPARPVRCPGPQSTEETQP